MESFILYPPTLPSTGTAWSTITGTPTTLAGYGITDAAAKTQTQEMFLAYVETPSNKTYHIVGGSYQAGTITSVRTYAQTGTCTLTVLIQGVAIGGSANSVSALVDTTAHSSNNAFVAGDFISIAVTANSSCRDMSVALQYTRTYS